MWLFVTSGRFIHGNTQNPPPKNPFLLLSPAHNKKRQTIERADLRRSLNGCESCEGRGKNAGILRVFDRIQRARALAVAACAHRRVLQSAGADERVSITAASIW